MPKNKKHIKNNRKEKTISIRIDDKTEEKLIDLEEIGNMKRADVIRELIQNADPLLLKQNYNTELKIKELEAKRKDRLYAVWLMNVRYLRRINNNFNQIARYTNTENIKYRLGYKKALRPDDVKPDWDSTVKIWQELVKTGKVCDENFRSIRKLLGIPEKPRGTRQRTKRQVLKLHDLNEGNLHNTN